MGLLGGERVDEEGEGEGRGVIVIGIEGRGDRFGFGGRGDLCCIYSL